MWEMIMENPRNALIVMKMYNPQKKQNRLKNSRFQTLFKNLLWMTKTINKPGLPFLNQNSKTTQNWLKLSPSSVLFVLDWSTNLSLQTVLIIFAMNVLFKAQQLWVENVLNVEPTSLPILNLIRTKNWSNEVIPTYDLDSSRPDKGKGGSML